MGVPDQSEPLAPPETQAATNLHASCVAIGEAGILIRGRSGSGKSTLAREILDLAETIGLPAKLVCDDRVQVEVRDGRLVASAVASIAGRLEIWGLGLVRVPWQAEAVVALVVDCDVVPDRLPGPDQLATEILGVPLRRLAIATMRNPAGIVLRVGRGLCDTVMTET